MKMFNGKKTIIYILLYILLISTVKNYENEKQIFKCGDYNVDPIIVPNQNVTAIGNNDNNLNDFKEFNIYLDLVNFNFEIEKNGLSDKKQLYLDGMIKAIDTLKALLKVKPVKNYAFSDKSLRDILINYWNTSKIGTEIKNGNKGMNDVDVDLYIFLRFMNSTEIGGDNVVASAGARYIDSTTGQPLIGIVNINKDIKYDKVKSIRYFQGIMLHQLTHILGFSNKFFKQSLLNMTTEKTNVYGQQKSFINSRKVIEVAKKYFNCNTIDGIELEESGSSQTIGSHWEERILLGDYMNRAIYSEEQVISEFTLALLEDTGFYKANYYTGGLMQYGKNKGCYFLDLKCVDNNHKINNNFKNEFFDINEGTNNNDCSCSSGRQSRAYHSIYQYTNAIPTDYQYYTNAALGGRSTTNYCPVSQEISSESEGHFYVGHCYLGSGDYGYKIPYIFNIENNNISHYNSSTLQDITNEKYSKNSFCIQSSLISQSVPQNELFSNTIRAVCYEMHCSDESLTIQINNDFIVCPRKGGKIKAENYNGYILCPDYYLICSGTVLCNDMFDCVEKQSFLKDNINYNYESKTSQDIEEAEMDNFSEDGYELSSNGKCPKYCSQCNEQGQCIKCKNDYRIVESTENEVTTRNCKLFDELSIGYYQNEGIYHKCMDNCETCVSNNECTECKANYGFNEENKSACLSVENNFDEYYTTDGKIFWKCDGDESNNKTQRISNCKKCQYNDGSLICNECANEYLFKDEEKNKCYQKSLFENNQEFFFENDNHVKNCSLALDNCKECKNENGKLNCLVCHNNYVIINNSTKSCISNETINQSPSNYFQENGEYYYCEKDSIQNCKSCNSRSECNDCKEGFINIEKQLCLNESELNESFISIDSQYKKCSSVFDNCKTCSTEDKCITCLDGYGLYNNKAKCIKIDEKHHYKNNTDLLYYPCNKEIDNCEKCTTSNLCIKCGTGYVKINDDKTKCIMITQIENFNEFYQNPEDDNNYKHCSSFINDCSQCDYFSGCRRCKEGYVLLNDDSQKCYRKDQISLDNYFTTNNIMYYDCKDFRYKNNVQCFSKNEKQNIVLTFVQAQLIDRHLYCFMVTHSPLPKNFSIKVKISITSKGKGRILTESFSVKELFTNDVSNGNGDTIISFTSNEVYAPDESIKVKEMSFNNAVSTTKQVTDNNFCTLNFNSNSQLVDTAKVKELIQAKKIPDCSQVSQEDLISLNMVNLEGCDFSLVTDSPLSFEKDNLDLELVQYNDQEAIAAVECDTKKENLRIINCKIKDSADSDSDYTFKNKIISESDKFLVISSDEDNFKVSCKNNKTLIIIIVVVVLCVLIAIAIVVIIIIYKRRKNRNKKYNSSIKSLSKKNNILTTSVKLNTKTTETKDEDILNLHDNKKKNKNKKSKPKTKAKQNKTKDTKKPKNKSKKKNKD